MNLELEAAIEQHALSDPDHEICGFLYLDHYLPLKTVSNDVAHFQAEPSELARAITKYGEPLAIFHTHPNGPLDPSLEDLASPYYINSIMIIGKIQDGKLQYRMFSPPSTNWQTRP
jgi:proteasome lid subunit RPN8/RPN11